MKKIYDRFFSAKSALKGALVAMMLVPAFSFGQIYYPIGTGTATNSTTSYPCPLGNWYDGLREQYLFTASELASAGFAAGTISEIAFDVTALNGVATLQNYTVYITSTTATSLSGWQTVPATPNYQGNYTVSTGWSNIALTNNFTWNGSDNLLIQICFENTPCYTYTSNPSVKYTTTTFTSALYVRNDCTSGMCTNSGYSSSSNRPNIRFGVLPPVADDAGIGEITSPGITNCALSNLPVKVKVSNLGSDWLTSCTIHWSINTQQQSNVSFNDSVAPLGGMSSEITLGTVSFTDGDSLAVWTSNPNNVQDSFPQNDTIRKIIVESMGGIYTIGGTSPDFATIGDAVAEMNARGICAPTTFNVATGTYTEQVLITEVNGASSMNTITFNADSGAVTIEYSSNSSIDNYTVKVSGADYVTFNGFTMDALGSTYAIVLDIDNGAMNSTFNDCFFNGANSSSTSNYQSVIYTYSAGNDNILFNNCEVNGGSYGYYYYGGGTESRNVGLKIVDCSFNDQYYYGIYSWYSTGTHLINNDFQSTSGYAYGYCVYSYYENGDYQATGNNINWPGYSGFYMNYLEGDNTNKPLIANNMIRVGRGTAAYGYGIYIYSGGFVRIANNTIATDHSSYTYYSIYVNGGANSVLNNNVYEKNGYNSTFYAALYYNGGFSVLESDHNNIKTNRNFGYFNGAFATLSDWQTGTSFGANSLDSDPGFTNLDSLRTCSDTLDGAGKPLDYVMSDFDGDGRHPSTPDIGADEWVGSAPGSYSAGNDAIICDGQTAEIGLQVTGGTFVWNTGDTTSTIMVNSEGTYTVSMLSGCGATHGDTVVVENATTDADFDQTVSFHTGSFDNTSGNGLSYMWVVHTTPADTFYSKDLTYVFPNNGPFDVDLYVYGGCDTSMTSQEWTGFVGIEEGSLENMITLMPNPATDVLNIKFDGIEGNVTVEMTNIQGQLVHADRFMNVSGNTETINVSSLKKGMYIVKFISNGEVATKQIIVQ
jgi:hypothetical protein